MKRSGADVAQGEQGYVRYAADMADSQAQTLGQLIRKARIDAGLGLRELAERLNNSPSPSYLSDIENDRRVPAEDVLRRIVAELPSLDFDEAVARAGRFGDDAERYLRRNPAATTLFRKIQERNLSEEEVRKLVKSAEKMGANKGQKE